MKQKELRKAIKCKFKTIIKDDNVYNKLLQIINKSNNVKFVCSNMINAYILYKTEGFKLFTYKQNCDINNYKLNSTNLSYIFNSYCIEMETNFINNITQNLLKELLKN